MIVVSVLVSIYAPTPLALIDHTYVLYLACAVRRVARKFGLRPVGDGDDWTVYWIDTSVILDRVMSMKRYQVREWQIHVCINIHSSM